MFVSIFTQLCSIKNIRTMKPTSIVQPFGKAGWKRMEKGAIIASNGRFFQPLFQLRLAGTGMKKPARRPVWRLPQTPGMSVRTDAG